MTIKDTRSAVSGSSSRPVLTFDHLSRYTDRIVWEMRHPDPVRDRNARRRYRRYFATLRRRAG